MPRERRHRGKLSTHGRGEKERSDMTQCAKANSDSGFAVTCSQRGPRVAQILRRLPFCAAFSLDRQQHLLLTGRGFAWLFGLRRNFASPEDGSKADLTSWLPAAGRRWPLSPKWDAQCSFPYGISVRALAPRFLSLSMEGPAPSDNLPTSRHRPILYAVVADALSMRGGVLG
jgi:hypothetical protein